MNIFREFINVGKNIAIKNNREVGNKIHEPYIKASGWNRNNIQQPMRSNSEVLAPLKHTTTLDGPFHIRDHEWLPHAMKKSLQCFTNAQMAQQVTEMKLSK